MIWIVASIPFWAVAAVTAIVAAACTWNGLSTRIYKRGVSLGKLDQPQHAYFLIGIGFWLISGSLTLIAAKICS